MIMVLVWKFCKNTHCGVWWKGGGSQIGGAWKAANAEGNCKGGGAPASRSGILDTLTTLYSQHIIQYYIYMYNVTNIRTSSSCFSVFSSVSFLGRKQQNGRIWWLHFERCWFTHFIWNKIKNISIDNISEDRVMDLGFNNM